MKSILFGVTIMIMIGCGQKNIESNNKLIPVVVTEQTKHDTDDPAIWIHPTEPSQSLIIGTDKNEDGALYVYNLDGKIDEQKTVRGLKRPNNVDVEYGLILNGQSTDIAVTTERYETRLRVYTLPDMEPIDNGGIDVFVLKFDRNLSSDYCLTEEIYGEYSEETKMLRGFRDDMLSKTSEGQEIIKLYYEWSPVIVKAMEEDKKFRKEIKSIIDEFLSMITPLL